MAAPIHSNSSSDSMEINMVPPPAVLGPPREFSQSPEYSDELPLPDDEISPFEVDPDSPAENNSSDEARAVFESQKRNFRQEMLEGKSIRSGKPRTESAPPRMRRKTDIRLLYTAPARMGQYATTDHRPLFEFLKKEGQIPEKEWLHAANDAAEEIGKMLSGFSPEALWTEAGWVDVGEGPKENTMTEFPAYKVVEALTVPCRDEDLQIMIVSTIMPNTFLGLTWERLLRYRRRGGLARPLKMEGHHMIIGMNELTFSIQYRQVTPETFDNLHSQLGDDLPDDVDPNEVYSSANELDQTVVKELNEFVALSRRAREICDSENIDTFQLMYFFLRYWAIQRGLYSNPGRPLHDIKILKMILSLPKILSFSQGICTFFSHHCKCTPMDCVFDYSQSPHYQTDTDAALWDCWSQRLHQEIHTMHETLNRELGIGHVCNTDVHDWVAFLNECSINADYNKSDAHRIIVMLQYTNNSPMLGRKLLDIMEEQIPLFHKFLHSQSLYQDCRVWPQRLTETHDLFKTSPYRCFWVFTAHKADRSAGARAAYDAIEDWLYEWKKMIAKQYRKVGGGSNFFLLTTDFYEPGHGLAPLKPDLRTLPRQEVKPPADIVARLEAEDEDFNREASSGSNDPSISPSNGAQGTGDTTGSQGSRSSKTTATASSAHHGSSSSKGEGQMRIGRRTDSTITDAMRNLSLSDEYTGTVGKGKKPYGKGKGRARNSSPEENSPRSKSSDKLVETPVKSRRRKGRETKRRNSAFDLQSSNSASSGKPVEEEQDKKSLMEASKILNRLRTDSTLNIDNYKIGYKDCLNRRKLQWKPAIEWETQTTAKDFISECRIQQFKDVSKNLVVWDKAKKLDLMTNKEGHY